MNSIIHVVDDDSSVRKSLSRVLELRGASVRLHASAEEFIAQYDDSERACLILDLRLPGLNGLELQNVIRRAGFPVPIVFMTGHGDIPLSVQAMRDGAVDFLTKPFRNADLLDALERACARAEQWFDAMQEQQRIEARFASLTDREREVLDQVARGKLNKVIAGELGITEKTVKVHRASGMKKLAADSVAELVRMQASLESASPAWGLRT